MIKTLLGEGYSPIMMSESCDDQKDERKDPKKPKGTYAAYRLDKETDNDLDGFLTTCGLQHLDAVDKVKPGERHVTLLYSRKVHDDYSPNPNLVHRARCRGYAMFGKALVMLLDCEGAEHRHRELMAKHGCTYDFESYNPHVTLAYGGMPVGFNVHNLPLFGGEIQLVGEYKEDLVDD